MKVCVFGASSTQIDPVFKQVAFDLGKAIADKNWSLVFGAGASGIMGASADGAMSIQGEIIGIVPSFFKELHHALHEGCTEMIFTETMRERKGKMEDLADAFIICPGGIGTYEEFLKSIHSNSFSSSISRSVFSMLLGITIRSLNYSIKPSIFISCLQAVSI